MSESTITADAIREIERLVDAKKCEVVEIDGVKHWRRSDGHLVDPRRRDHESFPETLTVHTLDALVEYILQDLDEAVSANILVHVKSPTEVILQTEVRGPFNERGTLLVASAYTPPIPWGQYRDSETFTVMLQSLFMDDGDRASVLATAGNVTVGATKTVEDDGVTQQVTAHKGVSRLANVKVPNPVRLFPYRTFREIVQPDSEFIFRMRGGGDNATPECALFEADGGLWRLTAVRRIREYLAEKLTEIPILA